MKETQIKKIADTMIILVDSREHLPNHVTAAFDLHGINWRRQKLKSGDYSLYIPPCKELGFEGLSLENILCLERKQNLTEISSNVAKNKERFDREFSRAECDIIIVIEDDTYEDLATGNYRSQLSPKQFLGLLHSFSDKHNAPFVFVPKSVSPLYIYNCLKYKARNILKSIE